MKARTTKRSESRRLEVKRQRTEQRVGAVRNLLQFVAPGAILIWAGFYVGCVVILLSGGESMPWRLNQLVEQDITARVPFTILDTNRTQQEREIARASAPNVYVANPAPLENLGIALTGMLESAKSSGGEPAKFKQEAAAKGWSISDAGLKALLDYSGEKKGKDYDDLVSRLIARLQVEYIVSKPEHETRTSRTSILQHKGAPDAEVPTNQLQSNPTRQDLGKIARQVVTDVEGCPQALHGPVADMIVRVLLGPPDAPESKYSPLWRYDPVATAQEMEAAEQRVEEHKIPRKEGDMLVPAGTRLSDMDLSLLKREHREYLRAQETDELLHRKKLLTQIGLAVTLLIVTAGFAVYVALYERRILRKPARSFGLAGLMLLMIGLSRVIERFQYPWNPPAEFTAAFVFMAAALLTIAYNQRFAFAAGSALALLITLTVRGDLGLFITLVAATGVTVFALKEVRTRTKIIAVGALSAVAAFIASMAMGLVAGQELLRYVFPHALAAAGAAVGAGFIVQGVLPNFEHLFSIATSMTLLEWCDASKRLLRRLAQEAPGTYSHSLMISQMAEEASEAIGANGLLARVGALYHDIGKIQKAQYFVENQEARMNRHDQLSPTMSLLIIVGHVKDGVEMAKAYGLPRTLHQFIAEHHGTTIVKYFHHAASEAAARNKGRHSREVPESEFRYPGPKPRSRETAILMLCDGCEGAVRALDEPTPGRIESVVHQVVMDRLNDGQFDDCDITLRELKIVETSLVKSLCAIHHGRIKYPKTDASEEAPEPTGPAPKDADQEKQESVQTPDQTPEVARQA